MYFPTIQKPDAFRLQTESQQTPFFFGASNVPYSLGGVPKAKPITRSSIRLRKARKFR